MSSKCGDLDPSVKPRMESGPCARRLWVFLVLGSLDIIFGLVTVGLYFNVQAITTSDNLTELFPGYIVCLAVSTTVLVHSKYTPYPPTSHHPWRDIQCGLYTFKGSNAEMYQGGGGGGRTPPPCNAPLSGLFLPPELAQLQHKLFPIKNLWNIKLSIYTTLETFCNFNLIVISTEPFYKWF